MRSVKINQRGLDLIKQFEGCRLKAYPDPATGGKPWTIGYGHTHNVKPGDVITQAQADEFLLEDLRICDIAVAAKVAVPLTPGQHAALCSFIFNLGEGNFIKSTLLKKLNAGDKQGAADEFGKWSNANGKPMPGLVKRRAAERELFLS